MKKKFRQTFLNEFSMAIASISRLSTDVNYKLGIKSVFCFFYFLFTQYKWK